MKKQKKQKVKVLSILAVIAVAAAMVTGFHYYKLLFGKAVELERGNTNFYIRTGWTEKDVLRSLEDRAILLHPEAFGWVMERKNYQGKLVVAGKYILRDGMSANELVDHLRAGNGREEVKITFNLARTAAELAGKASANIEADSLDIITLLRDGATAEKYGFDGQTFLTLFLPDTYNVYWDTDADTFIARMAAEYKAFWTAERKAKAAAIGLSQSEVSILASIVQAEQQLHADERPIIAGLYLNRLRRGMRLQSDPTVVYAMGDFNINRVLTVHLATPSPYNTYVNAGLPPGPINIPSKRSIDAVLNADKNSYIFMCAKADFSGYHAFAKSLSQHNKNARAFQQAMNERKIYR